MSSRSSTPLFDTIERHDTGPPSRTAGHYDYLNESGREEAAVVRAAYTQWLSRYPPHDRAEIVAKFRDSNDRNHTAGAFELALHEGLRGLGATVTVPPDLQHAGDRHDFDAERDGHSLAVEACLVTDESDEVVAAARVRARFLDALDARPVPGFLVHIWSLSINPKQAPSGRAFASAIRHELRGVSETERAQWAGHVSAFDERRLPRFTHERGGTRLTWSPVPVPGTLTALVTELPFTGGAMQAVTIGKAVHNRIRKKSGKRYGIEGRPLMLAMAVTHWAGSCDFEVHRALFGTLSLRVSVDPNDRSEPQPIRARDGAWGPHSKCDLRGVSGLLVLRRFQVWAPWATSWCLYTNPWARVALPSWTSVLPRWEARDGHYEKVKEGVQPADVMPFPFPEDERLRSICGL